MTGPSLRLLRDERIFQVIAVILILLLPVAARLTAPSQYTWSLLDPNLVQVHTGAGSVGFGPEGIAMSVNSTATESRLTAVTASTPTQLFLDASFMSQSPQGQFVLRVASPYDSRSASMILDAVGHSVALETTDANGATISNSTLGPLSPLDPFELALVFSPGAPLAFRVAQNGAAETANVSYPQLSGTVPVNFDLVLRTPSGSSVVRIGQLTAALPGSVRQYTAGGPLFYSHLALIIAVGVMGFRRRLGKLFGFGSEGLRAAAGKLVGLGTALRPVWVILLFALPIQAWAMSLGSHIYDVYTMELWGYISVKYGPSSVYPISLVVPGGKPVGWDSTIGSGYPYPPLSLYMFSAVGYVGRALDPSFVVPSEMLAILTKTGWLILLNVTGLVLANELRRRGVSSPGVILGYALVALNPGMLMEALVWGQFGIMVAMFLLLAVISALRDRWTAAFFFLLLAVVSKQGALLIAAIAIPAFLAKAGLRRGVWHLGLSLVPLFFVLLPLFLVGVSPSYVVDVSAGSVAFNVLSTSPVAIAPWQTIVSIGDFNIWPIVTALFNGQHGLGRFRFPDALPGQAFGLAYVQVGAILAASGLVVMLLKIIYSRKKGLLEEEMALIIALGFLWTFEVLTRLAGRYLVYMIPLALLMWRSPKTGRAGTILTALLSLDLGMSMLAGMGIEAVEVPTEFPLFNPYVVMATNDLLIDVTVAIQILLIAFLAFLAVSTSIRGKVPLAKSYAEPPKPSRLPPNPLVSVVVLSYNGKDYTMKCLETLLATSYANYEVIVADNGSTDGTVESLEPLISRGRIRLAQNGQNLRYAMGNNQGALSAKGDLLFFINNDTELEPDTIAAMVAAFREDPSLGAAQPIIHELSHRERTSSAGQPMDRLGFHEVLTELPKAHTGLSPTTSYASGAALMIRRDLFLAVGGFDPLFWFYHEDSDLSWKVWLAGYRVAVVPGSLIYHAEGGHTSAWKIRQRLTHVVRGQLIMLAKNYEGTRALGSTALLSSVYIGLGVAYAVRGRPSFAAAVFRGVGSFLLSLGAVAHSRAEVNGFRCRPDRALDTEMLAPFEPLAIFQRKRAGWGYIGDYEKTAL